MDDEVMKGWRKGCNKAAEQGRGWPKHQHTVLCEPCISTCRATLSKNDHNFPFTLELYDSRVL